MKFKIEIYGNILLTCLRHIKPTIKNLSKSFFRSPSKQRRLNCHLSRLHSNIVKHTMKKHSNYFF